MKSDGSDIFIIVLSGFFLMVVMVSFIVIMVIYHRQRQIKNQQKVREIQADYEKTVLNVEKELREDILAYVGKELHDNVGQLLSLAKMNLSSSKPEKVSEGKVMVNEIIHAVRILSKSLNIDWVEEISLEEFIQRELKKLDSADFCKVAFHQAGNTLRLEKDKKLVLIRIIQECLNNAIKHAEPKLIEIKVDSNLEKPEILIWDDGKGFEYNGQSSGLGIYNLKSRMTTIGGEMILHSVLGKGTEIKLILPNQNA
jgi:signal transduction histidine kinase